MLKSGDLWTDIWQQITQHFFCVETVEFAFYLYICEQESVLKHQKGCRGAACSASSLLIQCKNIQYLLKQKRVQI